MTIAYIGNRRPRPSSWDAPPPPGLGLGICRYDDATGALAFVRQVCPEISVGAVHVDAARQLLYCVHESMTLPGHHKGGGGLVIAYRIDPATGDLTELNRQPSHGTLPSYVLVDRSGEYLLVTNHTGHTPVTRSVRGADGMFNIELLYDDATTVLYPLAPDGSILAPCDIVRHEGGGGPLPLQSHSQLHSIEMSPSGNVFVVCDKGSDQVAVFTLDHAAGRLLPAPNSPHVAAPGSSPRYSAFHPHLPYFFVNHESLPLVASYRYAEDGAAELIGTLDLGADAPPDGPKLMQSDIRIHPDGRHLYTLLRGSNEVKVLAIDPATGQLTVKQSAVLDGDGPRGCTVSPDGRYLVMAALVSKEVLVWAIAADGTVAPVHKLAGQPFPGNITFFTHP